MSADRILGIDLGTTNSAVCVWEDGEPKLIPNSLNELLTPSAVSLDGETLVVGKAAKNRLISHPTLTTAWFKRYMGTDKTIKLGKKSYRPEELSAMILKSLREDAENYLGHPVNRAVISVPAYFNDIQRKATKQAGVIAGLDVERVINEPSAAALAYGINLDDSQTYVVIDLGGGTFDVSVIEHFDKIIEIKASSGDNFLGGEDFLQVMEGIYAVKCGIKPKKLDDSLRQSLLATLEQAKNDLTNTDVVTVPVITDPEAGEITISRDEFESASQGLLERIRQPIIQAVRDSQLALSEIDNVILVGGASRMPAIKKLTGVLFERIPSITLDPDTLIALGAGVQAGLKEKNNDLTEHVLTDVCPFTLGIGIYNKHAHNEDDDLFSPIIERNRTIPASREERFVTVENNQARIKANIYQGESRFVRNNINIGSLDISVPRNKAGNESIKVRFSYDMNGILDVDVTVTSTGKKYSTTIVNSMNNLSESEINKAREQLAKLKMHPRDSQKVRLLMSRADKLYEQSLGEVREELEVHMRYFESVIESQDMQQVDMACEDFSELLDALEGRFTI